MVASCVDTCQPIVLANFEDADDLKQSLRGSANVPEVAGAYVEHRGRRLVDAAVFEPVPFRAAIAEGCTHVLTLCSRPVSTCANPLVQHCGFTVGIYRDGSLGWGTWGWGAARAHKRAGAREREREREGGGVGDWG